MATKIINIVTKRLSSAIPKVGAVVGALFCLVSIDDSWLVVIIVLSILFLISTFYCNRYKEKSAILKNVSERVSTESKYFATACIILSFFSILYQKSLVPTYTSEGHIINELRLRNDTLLNTSTKEIDSLYDVNTFPAFSMAKKNGPPISVSNCNELKQAEAIPGMKPTPPIAYNAYQKEAIDCKILKLAGSLKYAADCPDSESVLLHPEKIPSLILKRYLTDYDSVTEMAIINNYSIEKYIKIKSGEYIPSNGMLKIGLEGYFYEITPLFSGVDSNEKDCVSYLLIKYGAKNSMLINYDVIGIKLTKNMYECLEN